MHLKKLLTYIVNRRVIERDMKGEKERERKRKREKGRERERQKEREREKEKEIGRVV